jgi:hypothetical protein
MMFQNWTDKFEMNENERERERESLRDREVMSERVRVREIERLFMVGVRERPR